MHWPLDVRTVVSSGACRRHGWFSVDEGARDAVQASCAMPRSKNCRAGW
ncbi:MAG: hypothetical protein IPF57_18905 [Gammaproteobacteria bacterium]|nr:hypothetical protein [Gammaproteobacteria bacterium]